MIRSSLAIIVAIFAWGLVATVGNWLLRAALPGYAAVETTFAFTLAMLFFRLALGLVSSLCGGAVCAAVAAQRSRAVWITGFILLLLFLPLHYSIWPKFPVWYHVFFLGSLVPMTLVGGTLYRRIAETPNQAMQRTAPRSDA
jgi:hypothetical protein